MWLLDRQQRRVAGGEDPDSADSRANRACGRTTSQLQDHQVELQLYTDEARSGTDPDLRAYAAKYLPLLQHHTEELQSMVSGAGRAG